VNLSVGDVVMALFPDHDPQGHEQQGMRPAVVLALPAVPLRFPTLILAPMTTDESQAWVLANPGLYLRFPAGVGGLRAATVLMLDQVRTIDADRVDRWRGALPDADIARVAQAIAALFGELLAFAP
jgi:mRNA interferase MazF